MGFIGETRFSLLKPDSPNWVASNGSRFSSAEQYRDYLYSSERLDDRCEIFLDISLPQLRLASSGVDYRHIVSYSDSLPAKYQLQLEQAANEFEFLVLDRQTSGTNESSWISVAKSRFGPNARGGKAVPFGWFRLDDDDLLSVDYFDLMRPYITTENAGMQVSLGKGLTALFEKGRLHNLRNAHRPLIAIGLLSICMFDAEGKLIAPIEVPHKVSDQFNPVIVDSRKISYLWLRHRRQDTSLRGPDHREPEELPSIQGDMDAFPRLQDLGEAEQAFPLASGRFSSAPSPGLALVASSSGTRTIDEAGVRFHTGSVEGLIQVELTLHCGEGAIGGSALVGLALVDREGEPLSPDLMRDELRKLGILYSQVPGIGHFRYLGARPGQSDYSADFSLPDGVFCTSVLIRRWGNSDLNVSMTRCSIFARREVTVPATGNAKVFIWGSCVTRDPFELESSIDIVDYRARSSLASAFASPPRDWEERVDLGALTSPFQRRMVTSDVIKTLADDLQNAEFDALVLDFIDERMSIAEYNDSVVTDSPELAATGFVAEVEVKHEPWSEISWKLRRAGIAALLKVVDPTRIIVNRVYWAARDNLDEEFVQARWIAKNNAFLRDLYEKFEEIPGIRFIDYPDRLLTADSKHHWGRQPYHYVGEVNQHFMRVLEALLCESN